MKPFINKTHTMKWKTLPVLMAASLTFSARPVPADNTVSGTSLPQEKETAASPASSSPNYWHLLTEDPESGSSSKEKKNRYESGWYKLNKAGDAAAPAHSESADSSAAPGETDISDETDDTAATGSSDESAASGAAGSSDGSVSEPAASVGMTQQEYEEALAAAYAAGYEDGYSAGADMDPSKLQIQYTGAGLSTDASTVFLTQGLPALRTPDAVAFCFAALDDFTGEKKLQLYRNGIVTDLIPAPEEEDSGSEDSDSTSGSSDDSIAADSGTDSSASSANTDSSSSSSDADSSSSSSNADSSSSSSDADSSSSSSDADSSSSSSDADGSSSSSDADSSSSSSDADGSSSSSDADSSSSSSDVDGSSSSSDSEEEDEPDTLEELTAELQGWLDAADEADLHLSIMMLDIETGTIVAYNSDEPFYSASSTKAHFVVSLADEEPESITEYEDTIKNVTIDSDNDSYKKLQQVYSLDYFKDWLDSSGVSSDVELDDGGYTFYSAEDLARLWLKDYLYFEENENGQTVGEWFETPNSSAIRPTVDEKIVTRTKAGWLVDSEKGYTATADAGVVYDGEHPYIIAILSDYPANMEKLEKYAVLLEKIHAVLTESSLEADLIDD